MEVACASFPKGNIYMQIRDTLGSIFDDEEFVDLFPTNGQPAYAPWRLALVCIMQFLENLSDRQAADAVRGHIVNSVEGIENFRKYTTSEIIGFSPYNWIELFNPLLSLS